MLVSGNDYAILIFRVFSLVTAWQGRPTRRARSMTTAEVTLIGNLTADPTLRLTNGTSISVANFSVAHTPRRRGSDGSWEDAGDTLFVRVTAWRSLAENAAASLHKGDSVVVIGRLGIRHYPKSDGTTGSEVVCEADSISADLRWASATLMRFESSRDVTADEPWAKSAAS